MRKILCFYIAVIVHLSALSQGAKICSVTIPSPGNTPSTYYVTFVYGFNPFGTLPVINWNLPMGSTIVSQNNDPSAGPLSVTINWANASSSYSISVTATDQTGMIQSGSEYFSPAPTSNCWIWPSSQAVAVYNGSACTIYGNRICISGSTNTYQWQRSDTYDPVNGYNWYNISGATSQNYDPGGKITSTRWYRRITTASGQTIYSNPAAVRVPFFEFTPGVIATNNSVVSYNTSPVITATYAGGDGCSQLITPTTYSWEQLTEQGAWVAVGNTPYYPPTAPPIRGTTKVRRAVQHCGGNIYYTNELVFTVNYTSSNYENLNYVRENTILKRGIYSWQEADFIPIGDKFQSTTYLDGLGRSIQAVDKGISPAAGNTWKDIVKHYEYDEAGRTKKGFLPYATATNAGKFKTDAATAQPAYITSFFGEPSNAPAYSLAEYDESPLNRITKSMAPGQSWAGSNIGVTTKDDYNNANEKVHIWNLAYSPSALPVSDPTLIYPTGTLSKSIGTDEKFNKVISYTDLSGKLVLKKIQQADIPGIDHTGWVCTYYVYDDFGQLRYIISHKAVAFLDNNGWNLSQPIADELCYKYIYDEKGRMIAKKQPGVLEEKMIYDKKDRLVLAQHANQDKANNTTLTKNQWSFVLYDDLNRSVATGLLENDGNQATLQGYVNLLSNSMVTISAVLGGSGTYTVVADNPVAGSSYLAGTYAVIYNSLTHYDNYAYTGVKSFSTTYTLAYSASTPNIEATVKTNRVTGMVTGEKIRILDGDNISSNDKFLFSTAYYDETGGTLESLVDNNNMNNGSGTDYQVNQYDFAGKLMSSYTSHKSNASTTYTITSKNEFDKVGRLTKLSKYYNGAATVKDIAIYAYDELGQLKTRRLAPGYTATGANEIELLTYDYNIQGSLTGINKDYALSDNTYSQWEKYFGMYLGYDNRDDKFLAAQYNGNITGTIWKSQGDNSPRKFDYTYDKLDRFTSAIFKQKKKPSETTWSNTEVDFSTTVEYEDGNGNIKSMKHMGVIPGINNGVVIDDLRYTYLPTGVTGLNGNKLKQVDDLGTIGINNGLLGDFKDVNTTQDYFYDVNGNLVKDLNKGIKNSSANGVIYNFMNKPEKIIIENKSTIEFTYDASGEKLKKKVTYADNSVRYTTYIGDYIYEQFIPSGGGGLGDLLQYVLHEEGRLKIITAHTKTLANDYELNAGAFGILNWPGSKQGVFEYFIKDQLGSTRMVLTEEVQKEFYVASMQVSAAAQEEPLFGQVDPATGNATLANELKKTRMLNSPPTTTVWPGNNTDVAKLTATSPDKVLGPNMVLKVMAGDMISSNVKYYYLNNNSAGSGNVISNIGTAFVNALTGVQSSALGKNQSGQVSTNLTTPSGNFATNFLSHNNEPGSTPKAYLNIAFLDEQFKFIEQDLVTPATGSWFTRVNANNNPNATLTLQQKAPKNGWVFVYLTNESNEIVYFDDLAVTQEHSRIAEENHYYPFGLKISGISSRAYNKLSNKYNYQGDFSEEEVETGWDEFDLRMYDPQIGRWIGSDPEDLNFSPYIAMDNDPINLVDPDGAGTDDDPPHNYVKLGKNIYQVSIADEFSFLNTHYAKEGYEWLGSSLKGYKWNKFWGGKYKFYETKIGWGVNSEDAIEEGVELLDHFATINIRNSSGARNIINKVPLVGSLVNVIENISKGEWAKATINALGGVVDYFSLGGASLFKMGGKQLLGKIVSETFDNVIEGNIGISPRFLKAASIAGITHGHHPWAKYLGGPDVQDLTNLGRKIHQQLHKDMIVFLKKFRAKTGINMVPSPKNKTEKIIKNVSQKTRLKAQKDFYKEYGSKYKKPGDEFNRQFGNLIK